MASPGRSGSRRSHRRRASATLVYDQARDRLVLVGGFSIPADDAVWEYDVATTTWTKVTTTGLTGTLAAAATVYDPTRSLIVVQSNADTWEYAPATATWVERTWPTAPSDRRLAAGAFLPSRGAVVVFGGLSNGSTAVLSDTWEYRATGWTQVPTAVAPQGRFQASATFDEDRGALVLVGGRRAIPQRTDADLGRALAATGDGGQNVECELEHGAYWPPPGARTRRESRPVFRPLRAPRRCTRRSSSSSAPRRLASLPGRARPSSAP